jgi:hypothetical protein
MSRNAQTTALGAFTQKFDRVFCISLPRSSDRRAYISGYFEEVGIEHYEFFDATDRTDGVVSDYYTRGQVATYPPCFRCHKLSCGSDTCNNVLIPAQVATFITYLQLWQEIVKSDTGTALILEDDVRFTDYAAEVTTAAGNTLAEAGFHADNPVLLRFGWAWCSEHKEPVQPGLERGAVRMSNPCHAITRAFAKQLVSSFSKIDTTVDIFQHQQVGEKAMAFTFFPPLAYELSWSVGALDSLIHPKPIRVQYMKQFHPDKTAHIQSAARALHTHFTHVLYRPLLIVGHPRCGSGYMSKLLQALGLDVGHEKMGQHGISSWMFAVDDDEVPFAQDKYSASRRTSHFQLCIQHVRDPRAAVPSIMRDNKYSDLSFQFRCKHIKQRYEIDLQDYTSDIERAVLSYICWNRIIAEGGVGLVVRVEDAQEKLIDLLLDKGVLDTRPVQLNLPPKNVNSDKPYRGVVHEKPQLHERDWQGIDPSILSELNAQCRKYGYAVFTEGVVPSD